MTHIDNEQEIIKFINEYQKVEVPQTHNIYCISNTDSSKCYIGSTVQSLQQRLKGHESDCKCYLEHRERYKSSSKIIKDGDYSIQLLQSLFCTRRKALILEKEYIKKTPNTVNEANPINVNRLRNQKQKTMKAFLKKAEEPLLQIWINDQRDDSCILKLKNGQTMKRMHLHANQVQIDGYRRYIYNDLDQKHKDLIDNAIVGPYKR